jgi:Galactose oxidase, central domain
MIPHNRMKSGTFAIIFAAAFIAMMAAGCGASQPSVTRFKPVGTAPTGDLIDSRFAATATMLQTGQVLVVGGVASEGSASASAELYDPAAGAFARTGSLSVGRAYHTATLLADGRVLVAGGLAVSGQPVAPAEIYDPSTGKFSVTGRLTDPRYNHTATLLHNGKVLIAGGDSTSEHTTNLDTAELYDPASGTFAATGNVERFYDPSVEKFFYQGKMNAAHGKHTATILSDGNVLIAGGGNAAGDAEATCEIYDAASGKFRPTGALQTARESHRATLLQNGDVLITGGTDSTGHVLASAELYDPATSRFRLTTAAFPGTGTNMIDGRYEHTATMLTDGRVLIAGGGDSHAIVNTAELYDPSRGSFSCVSGGAGANGTQCSGSMTEYRDFAAAVALPDGEVLIVGGYDFKLGVARNPVAAQGTIGSSSVPFAVLWSAEVYNPAAGTFVSTKSIAHAHFASSGGS